MRNDFSERDSVYAIQLLTQEQLNALNSQITNSANDKWTYTTNCSSFASKMWNINAEYKVSAGIVNTPVNLKNSILNDAGGNYRIGYP